MSREEAEQKAEALVQLYLEALKESLNEKFVQASRHLTTNLAELEYQILEKIDILKDELELVKGRLSKLEDNSAWNLLVEEAKNLNLTPEQLLKRAITEYTKRKRD
jgi:hypothetical protein